MDIPNVIPVFMGYIKPTAFDKDYPDHEFLRKPIKESALIRCLRDIWIKLDNKQKKSGNPLIRVNSGENAQAAKEALPLNILVVEGTNESST